MIIYDREENFGHWKFPSLENSQETTEAQTQAETDDQTNIDIENLKNEAEVLRLDYENKLGLLNNIVHTVEKTLAKLEDDIINGIEIVIEILTKKIIQQAISVEPELLKKMIDEMTKLVKKEKTQITINLSESDFNMINTTLFESHITFNTQHDLQPGDIKLSTSEVDICGLLDKRISKLMGI